MKIYLFLLCFPLIQAATKKRGKFVRLPSGLTFPASAASNFQSSVFRSQSLPDENQILLQSHRLRDTGNNEYTSYKETPAPPPPPPPSPPPSMTRPPMEYSTMPPAPITVATTAVSLSEVTAVSVVEVTTTAATHAMKGTDRQSQVEAINRKYQQGSKELQEHQRGHTYTALSGGQFYQSLLGTKNSFSPLSFFLNHGLGGGGGAGGAVGGNGGFFVPVPIVVPPPPPPPPGPTCYTNPSGFLCCNVTLEKTMEQAYAQAIAEGASHCNVQKMASAVQEAAEKEFKASFESIAAHKDFVAKINFAGDLNCKIEVDGKYILAYATPNPETDVNIVDANSFFTGGADEVLESQNGTKPTYIVYGPIR